MSWFLDIKAVAGTQEKAGGYCGNIAKKPEQKETDAVRANPADVVIDKNHTGVECGEKQNCGYSSRDKWRPEDSYNTLYDRDTIHHRAILHWLLTIFIPSNRIQ